MKASRSEWAALEKQIAEDTELTISESKKAIERELKDGRLELSKLRNSIESVAIDRNKVTNDHDKLIEVYKSEISTIQYDKKVLLQTNTDLSAANIELQSQITVKKNDIQDLTDTEEVKRLHLIELTQQSDLLEQSIQEKKHYFQEVSGSLSALIEDYNNKKGQTETEISTLELKRDQLAQEILDNRSQQEKVRDNLADWQKNLDEKDKNLRIREQRVNQTEQRIARNYNLLNL